MEKMKLTIKKSLVFIIALIAFISVSAFSVSAHHLYPWSQKYQSVSSTSTDLFVIKSMPHINGNNVKYYWEDNTAKSKFDTALKAAFTNSWGGIISGEEKDTAADAHIKISYDSFVQPDNAKGRTKFYNCDQDQHIRLKKNISINPDDLHDAEIVFYNPIHSTVIHTDLDRQKTAAHELGHLWGINDVPSNTKNSIYAKDLSFANTPDPATWHDKNALFIGIGVAWYYTGMTTKTYMYQKPSELLNPMYFTWSTIEWAESETITIEGIPCAFDSSGKLQMTGDIDGQGYCTAANARTVLRVSSRLEYFNKPTEYVVADVDRDGVITSADARLILRYSSRLIQAYP